MNAHTEELISAAMDGETVDVAALRAALSTADGQRALASFVLLRAATVAGNETSEMGVAHVMEKRTPWLLRGPRVPTALAASLALVAVAASVWLGSQIAPFGHGPAMTPVVRETPPPVMQPAPTVPVPSAVVVVPAAMQSPAARPCVPDLPKITKVVKFVPGVDWKPGS